MPVSQTTREALAKLFNSMGNALPEQIFVVARNDQTWKNADGNVYTNIQNLPQQLRSI